MLIFHADDYGILKDNSHRILECIEYGAIQSISLMPNNACFEECMQELKERDAHVLRSLHLNFVEGHALADREKVSLLTDDGGIFTPSFAKFLMVSYIPGLRRKYLNQFKHEIEAQLDKAWPYLDSEHLRLDSHCHYHMIPVIFDALVQVIEDRKLKVEYIRIPCERASFYKQSELNILMINKVKVMVLNLLAKRNLRRHAGALKDVKKAVFLGVMLSGEMNYANMRKVLPKVLKYAKEHQTDVEILFHPGGTKDERELKLVTFEGDRKAYSSVNRNQELDSCMKLFDDFRDEFEEK